MSGGSARVTALVRLTVPMLAVSFSANLNLFLMRQGELESGLPVTTRDGEYLGRSVVAARYGLMECGATRVLWTFMLLTATPVCVSCIGTFALANSCLQTQRCAAFRCRARSQFWRYLVERAAVNRHVPAARIAPDRDSRAYGATEMARAVQDARRHARSRTRRPRCLDANEGEQTRGRHAGVFQSRFVGHRSWPVEHRTPVRSRYETGQGEV